ncbi:MAG: hypothetical protein H7Y38_08560 [Armatimonadetes bacterium]|nr:hypothetical protein [Armatimonadota bacterium]
MNRYFIPAFFLTLTVALYVWSVRVFRQYDWTPVRMPISFEKARSYTATFRADKTTTYYAEVESNRPTDDSSFGEPLRANVASCTVRDGNGEQIGNPGGGGGFGKKIYSTLTKFPATRGETYSVTVAIAPANILLNRLNPHLKVEITPVDFKEAYVNTALIKYGALFSAVVTVATLIYAISRRR